MYRFPKTEKGLRSRIASYRAAMQKERRAYGAISDGSGTRYVLFWLHFLLNDLKAAKTYFRWYEKQFDDDVGEPIQKLCWAVSLYRMDDEKKAKYVLADLMLSNIYFIPSVIGLEIERQDMWHASSDANRDYADEIPVEILNAVTATERAWIAELHDSLEFRRYRKRHIEIYRELANTRDVEKRIPLVRAAGALLDELKKGCR
jgi:hypothetical protein